MSSRTPGKTRRGDDGAEETEATMTAKSHWTTWLSVIVGGGIGYVATHYLTGANGATHGLVGLVVGGFTPLLVALIRGDDLGSRKR